MAAARSGLRRAGAALGGVFVSTRPTALAYAHPLCRQSSGECRLLDSAADRRQSNRQFPVAVSLAGPVIGGLFLQCAAVIRLAGVELGRCQGADCDRCLPWGRASGVDSGCARAPYGEANALLPGFL